MGTEKGGPCWKDCRPACLLLRGWGGYLRRIQVQDCKLAGAFFTSLWCLKELTFFGSLFMALPLVLEDSHWVGWESKTAGGEELFLGSCC